MIADGERLKSLVQNAQRNVLLCAPFIKVGVLQTILSVIAESVTVRIVTRWRPAEVRAGVSDLEVFEVANERVNTELALLDDLHAKLYQADDRCLVGSANLTGPALGWANRSNIEILLPISCEEPEIQRLLEQLEEAQSANFAQRQKVEEEAAALPAVRFDDGEDIAAEAVEIHRLDWLPRCAAPDRLYSIYENPETTAVVENTKEDGLADLADLRIQGGLSSPAFISTVANGLVLMPGFKAIVDHIPEGLTDAKGISLVREMRPEFSDDDIAMQWRIIRDWIRVFFPDQFEVAPESFITRIKSR